jgi:hypothetical protein
VVTPCLHGNVRESSPFDLGGSHSHLEIGFRHSGALHLPMPMAEDESANPSVAVLLFRPQNWFMSKGPRSYEVGTERALFRLAKGTCYYPRCEVPVITVADGHAIVGVEIAHIRGAKKGSSRFDESMTDQERAAFPNLILLCNTHHKLVDRLEPHRYTVEVLTEWKTANEPEGGLSALDTRFNASHLETLLEQFATQVGMTREINVLVTGGVVTHSDGVLSMPLNLMKVFADSNPEQDDRERIIVASIHNTGTLAAVIDAVDFYYLLTVDATSEEVQTSLLGRNDFPPNNPPLPYRLEDGASVQWLMKFSTVELMNQEAAFNLSALRAVVRLGSGEHIESQWISWPKELNSSR